MNGQATFALRGRNPKEPKGRKEASRKGRISTFTFTSASGNLQAVPRTKNAHQRSSRRRLRSDS